MLLPPTNPIFRSDPLQQCNTGTSSGQTQHLQSHGSGLPRRPRTGSRSAGRHGAGIRRATAAAASCGGRAGRGNSRGARRAGASRGAARDDGGNGDALGLADLGGEDNGRGLVGFVAGACKAAGDVAEEGLVLADALGVGTAAGVGTAGELLRSTILLFKEERRTYLLVSANSSSLAYCLWLAGWGLKTYSASRQA